MNTENNMQVSQQKNTRAAKAGARALIVTAIVLVALILLNLLVALLPATLTQLDTTSNHLYSISSVTKNFLALLEEDVTVYVICEKGTAALMPRALLELYEANSKHVKVKLVDPVSDAELLADYGDFSSATNYSMIVVSDRRYSVVDFADCQYYKVEGLGMVPSDQYAQLLANAEALYYYYTYYGIDLTAATPYFAPEGALTDAIEYVTAPVIPTLHVLDDSAEMGSYLTGFIDLVQPEYATLPSDSTDAIPDHTAPLLIYAPEQDISVQTAEMIAEFVQKGGHLMLITAPHNVSMPNLMSLVTVFGVSPMEGVLCEGNANNFDGDVSRLLPNVNTEHDITAPLVQSGYSAPLLPNAHGIAVAQTLPEGISVTSLFTTSNSAYTVAPDGTEQTVGEVAVGIAAEHQTTGAKLFWLSSSDALSDELIDAEGTKACASYYATFGMIWQSESYDSKLSAIEPIDVSQDTVLLEAPAVIAWSVVLVLIVPLCVLVPGIVVKVRRSRQ